MIFSEVTGDTRAQVNTLNVFRRTKPSIPLIGEHGILLRYEIKFEERL